MYIDEIEGNPIMHCNKAVVYVVYSKIIDVKIQGSLTLTKSCQIKRLHCVVLDTIPKCIAIKLPVIR